MKTVFSGIVATGGDDAGSYCNGPAPQARISQLFNRSEEGIDVNVKDLAGAHVAVAG
jgi:hypothetical protein